MSEGGREGGREGERERERERGGEYHSWSTVRYMKRLKLIRSL